MESSSLVKAQDHARAAAVATQTSDTTVAINEHALAAGEFANAAKGTTSVEALRQLKLLEQYHQQLSELLKFPHENPVGKSTSETDSSHATEKAESTTGHQPDAPTLKRESSKGESTSKPSPSQQKRRYPPSRELSSSIASNLASARGIRSKYKGQAGQPSPPSLSNEQAHGQSPGSLDGHRKDGSRAQMQSMVHSTKGQPSWVPPSLISQTSDPRRSESGHKAAEEAAPGDEGFSRFYSTFGNLINRLSAPLAFAGLPLIAEEEAAPAPEPKPRPASTRGSSEPDVFKTFSKATLRALAREGNGPADSFYVVPKTGHTASYANILNYDQKEKRRIAASIHGDEDFLDDPDEDDFVDARESQSALPGAYKKRTGKTRTEKDYQNTIEELHTKNVSLHDMIDKLSKRLHAFEANAQQTHMAMQESMRFMRPSSPMSSSGGAKAAAGDDSIKAINKRLEEDLALAVAKLEKLEKENGRMEKTLVKYRDKWDKLKAGAIARRAAQGADSGEAGVRSP